MSDEPRQPIEEALRDYAEARRRAAGGPFVMPPHVRSQLHREIARLDATRPGPETARPARWWQALSRRWAWGGVALVVLLGVVTWRSFDRAPAVQSVAKAELPAAPAPPKVGPAPAQASTTRASPLDKLAVNAGAELTSAPVTPAPAGLAPAIGGAGASRADGANTRPAAALASEALEEKVADSVATAAARPFARYAVRDPAPTLQQNFRQEASQVQNAAWSNFRIEQVGNALQVVDAEGAAYPARLVAAEAPVPAAVTASAGRSGPRRQNQRVQGSAPAVNAPAAVPNRAAAPADSQAFTLVAEGTNARSQQRVMLMGNLVLTNLGGPMSNATQLQVTNVAALQFLLSNARFEGQLTLDRTNQVPVVAVPDGP